MARIILQFHPTLELTSRDHPSTALAWAIFGSGNSWRRDTADYPGAVQSMLDAGAKVPHNAEDLEPSDAVMQVLS